MGWFGKEKKEEEENSYNLPELPELPKLPELPSLNNSKNKSRETPHQLPSFPTNSLGEKFSQNAIKEAVVGKRGEGHSNDFAREQTNMQRMNEPFKKQQTKEFANQRLENIRKEIDEIPKDFREAAMKVRKNEPVFIQIDKFEESLKIFEKTKEQISEIDIMLKETKKLKEEEEKELEKWESEMQKIKEQIQKIDKEIFSKV
jgi:chromosome segregation ATPase